MKRSEMINKLMYLICTCEYDCPSEEDILKCIEENGMLPPKWYNQMTGDVEIRWEPEEENN